MAFNVDKCKVMHLGGGNIKQVYCLEGRRLGTVMEERDLGVTLTADLKPSKQCRAIYNKAIKTLGMINRTVKYKNRRILLCLYKVLVRPILEYCIPAWSPQYIKDKFLLERVQHRFTRMVHGMKLLEYEGRLATMNLWSLEERRNRADLIEVFKIMKGLTFPGMGGLFQISSYTRTRGHSLKLAKNRSRMDLRKYFFSERVVGRWNGLDQDTIDSQTIVQFKNSLQRIRSTRIGFFLDV